MTRYTVVWHEEAVNELARMWLASSDRTAVRLAANAIDQHLAVNAAVRGTAIPDNLRQLIVPPLRVLFAVSDADRIVQILDLARSRSDP